MVWGWQAQLHCCRLEAALQYWWYAAAALARPTAALRVQPAAGRASQPGASFAGGRCSRQPPALAEPATHGILRSSVPGRGRCILRGRTRSRRGQRGGAGRIHGARARARLPPATAQAPGSAAALLGSEHKPTPLLPAPHRRRRMSRAWSGPGTCPRTRRSRSRANRRRTLRAAPHGRCAGRAGERLGSFGALGLQQASRSLARGARRLTSSALACGWRPTAHARNPMMPLVLTAFACSVACRAFRALGDAGGADQLLRGAAAHCSRRARRRQVEG